MTAVNNDSGVALTASILAELNVRGFGAIGDGVTDDATAFVRANAALTMGQAISVPPGTYRINSDTSITGALRMDGGIIKPASGVTIHINGAFTAALAKCFDTSLGGTIMFGSSAGQWNNTAVGSVHPEWWGVNGLVAPYDTAAVQAAFDCALGIPVHFTRDYYVTTVGLDATHNQATVYFNGFQLFGMASSATDCILRIRGGYLTLYQVAIYGNLNDYYSCAVHWYGDASNTFPGFNIIHGLWIRNIRTGLVIGSLPGGGVPYNAPAGDVVYNLKTQGVQKVVHVDQPNGKITFIDCEFIVTKGAWGGSWDYAQSYCIKNVPTDGTGHGGGEIIVLGGLIQSSDSDAAVRTSTIIDVSFISIDGAIWEGSGKSYIRNSTDAAALPNQGCRVHIANIQDGGGPTDSSQDYFVIDAGAHGILTFENCFWNLTAGSATVDLGGRLVNSNNSSVDIVIDRCTIMEWPLPLVTNGTGRIRNTRYITYDGTGTTLTRDSLLDGPVHKVYSAVGAVGTPASLVETVLATYTLPKLTLINNGDLVRVRAFGTTAANGNAKTIRFYFGTDSFVVNGVTGSPNGVAWSVDVLVARISNTSESRTSTAVVGSVAQAATSSLSLTETLSSDVVIKVSGQNGVATANDIVLHGMIVEHVQ